VILEAAQKYPDMGWRVLPVHSMIKGECTCGRIKGSSCKPGKHPRINSWQKSASRDPNKIERWFTKWPHSNIGILTGLDSKLVVLDVDKKNGGLESLDKLQERYGNLETLVSDTGGGGVSLLF